MFYKTGKFEKLNNNKWRHNDVITKKMGKFGILH